MLFRSAAVSCRSILICVLFVLTAVIAYLVCRIPVQVSDSVGNLLQIQHQPLTDVFISQFSNGPYLRPLLWVEIKLGFELARGHEQIAFKAIHVIQLLLLAVLFVRPMQVRTRADLVAGIFGALVLFGMHTFDGMVREAFPINSFLTIAICVLAAAHLTIGEPRWWRDLAAVALFAFAVLTVESGILVFAALAVGRFAGLRGVSWRGVLCTAIALGGYLMLRLALDLGRPGLGERASGFGFHILEPPELIERFAANPLPFYAYNMLSSFVSVFLSEPRAGVWWATQVLANGGALPAWLHINLVASLAATAIVIYGVVGSLKRWIAGERHLRDQIILVGLAMVIANAVVSFGYTKDVILSTGGVFFALATYAGASRLLGSPRPHTARKLAYVAVVLAMGLWSVRTVALAYRLRMQAAHVQAEWKDVHPWFEQQHIDVSSPDAAALVRRLRDHALRTSAPRVEWTGWRTVLDLN